MSVPSVSGSDSVLGVLSSALDGLSLRQDVIANNIANVDTPGFRARSVEFESSLRDAVRTGGSTSLRASEQVSDAPVGANDNSVDLRQQVLAAEQTQFQYQLMTRAVSDQYSLIKTASAS